MRGTPSPLRYAHALIHPDSAVVPSIQRVLVTVLGILMVACGGEAGTLPSATSAAANESNEAAGSARPAGSGTPTSGGKPVLSAKSSDAGKPVDAPAGDVQPEMGAFLAMFDGSDDCVPKALKKFGKGNLDDKDMSMYMLREARVIRSEKKSDKTRCYDFEAKGGSLTYTFEGVCWEAGKIVSVEGERPQE